MNIITYFAGQAQIQQRISDLKDERKTIIAAINTEIENKDATSDTIQQTKKVINANEEIENIDPSLGKRRRKRALDTVHTIDYCPTNSTESGTTKQLADKIQGDLENIVCPSSITVAKQCRLYKIDQATCFITVCKKLRNKIENNKFEITLADKTAIVQRAIAKLSNLRAMVTSLQTLETQQKANITSLKNQKNAFSDEITQFTELLE